jgi:tetratricopeptide (TPR) repeat protein
MSRQEREEELRKLIAVSKYDKWNIRLARKTARIAISLEEWKQAEEMLKPFVSTWEKSEEGQPLKKALKIIQSADDPDKLESAQRVLEELRDPDTSAILMDYGWAQWKDHVKKGQSYLQWAIGLYPQNLDGYVFLAETYIEAKQESKALEVYEKASKLAPADPRVLAGLLYCRIRIHRNLEFVPVARAGLETTIEHCREWARVGVHLPWAFYDIGLFSWLLGRPYESLKAYAKAIQLSDTDSPIQKALDRTVKIEETLGAKLPELGWIRKLLTAGKAAKLSQMASAAEKKLRCLRDQHGPEKVQKAIEIAQEQVSETQRAHKKAIAECRRERSKSSCLLSGKSIVIVAGGCDRNVEGRIQEYKLLIETAFREYDGTVFSGCTDAGVGRLVGDLPASNRGMITKIAYIPKQISSDAKVHQAYTLCKTEGIGFSASDSIQNWIDIIAAGIDPSKVKLLGINGGQIAAFEYRLVLAMGAKVGILPDSGRAASEIFGDEFWVDSPGLIWLPNDVETVKLFVRGLTPCRALADHRESIAREIHEEVYRPEAIRNAVKREPNLQHWEELPEDLKESNRRQVDHIEEKLRAIGRKVHYVGKGPIDPIEFSDEQVEILAEMEHGRWTVERLLAGWRLGEKDIAKKKSPSLVAWSDLPDEIKKYDYDAVRDIPYRLGKWGYEIILEKQNGS